MASHVRITLHCDMNCTRKISFCCIPGVTEARRLARAEGWRRDKVSRDVCPGHPKLKGAR